MASLSSFLNKKYLGEIVAISLLLITLGTYGYAAWPAKETEAQKRQTWDQHLASCRAATIDSYLVDRARVLRGRVLSQNGDPIAGVRVSVIDNLLASSNIQNDTSKIVEPIPLETAAVTDESGRFEIADLSTGSKSYCFYKEGWQPAIRLHQVIQDGFGQESDIKLRKTDSQQLEIDLLHANQDSQDIDSTTRSNISNMALVPMNWWPDPLHAPVVDQKATFELAQLPVGPKMLFGLRRDTKDWVYLTSVFGPSEKPIPIDVSRLEESEGICQLPKFEPKGKSSESVAINGICTAKGETSPVFFEDGGKFWSIISPAALLGKTNKSSGTTAPELVSLKGFTSIPFSPVQVTDANGQTQTVLSNAASEYFFYDLTPGICTAKSMSWGGKVSFTKGANIQTGSVSEVNFSRFDTVKLNDEKSRQVFGFVKWPDGKPVAGATVFIQDTASFRRYLRRLETNKSGFFSFGRVPANRSYLIFAYPKTSQSPLRNFEYFFCGNSPSMRKDVVVYSESIQVSFPGNHEGIHLQLRATPQSPDRVPDSNVQNGESLNKAEFGPVLWWSSNLKDGLIRIDNIQPGEYFFTDNSTGKPKRVSAKFRVNSGETVKKIDWTKKAVSQ